jgi:hypothetical protein
MTINVAPKTRRGRGKWEIFPKENGDITAFALEAAG